MSRRESFKIGLQNITSQKESSRRASYLEQLAKSALAPERSVLSKNPILKEQVTNASLLEQASSIKSVEKDPLQVDSVHLPKHKDVEQPPSNFGLLDHWQMQNITERSTGRERDVGTVEGRNVPNDLRAVESQKSQVKQANMQSTRDQLTRVANDTLLKSSRMDNSPGSFKGHALAQRDLHAELKDVQMSTIEQQDRMNVIGLIAQGAATPPTIQQVDEELPLEMEKRRTEGIESSLNQASIPQWDMREHFRETELNLDCGKDSARVQELQEAAEAAGSVVVLQGPFNQITMPQKPVLCHKQSVTPVQLFLPHQVQSMSPKLIRMGGHVDQMQAYHVHTSTLLKAGQQLQPYRRSPRTSEERPVPESSYTTNRGAPPSIGRKRQEKSPNATERPNAAPLLSQNVNLRSSKNRNSTTSKQFNQRGISRQFKQSFVKSTRDRFQPSPANLSKSQISDLMDATASNPENKLAENLFGKSRQSNKLSSKQGVDQRPDILDMLDNFKLPPALFSAQGGSRALHTSIDIQPGFDMRRATLAADKRSSNNNSLIKVVPVANQNDPYRTDFNNSMKLPNAIENLTSSGHASTDLTASHVPQLHEPQMCLYSNPGHSILYQLQGKPDSPRAKGGKKVLTRYKNYIDQDGFEMTTSEGLEFAGTRGISGGFPSLLSDRRTERRTQDAKRDIIKFYRPELIEMSPVTAKAQQAVSSAQAKERIRNQELNRQFLTQSSHYKYSRLKDGDWGLKGPMRDQLGSIMAYNQTGVIESRLVPDSASVGARKGQPGSGLKLVHKNLKQKTARRAHHLNNSVDGGASSKVRQLFQLDDSLKQKRHYVAAQFQDRSPGIRGTSIFASVAEDEMKMLAQRNTSMLQDTVGALDINAKVPDSDFLDNLCEQRQAVRSSNSSTMQQRRDSHALKTLQGYDRLKITRKPFRPLRDSMNLYNSNATPLIQSHKGGDNCNDSAYLHELSANALESDVHASTLYKVAAGSVAGAGVTRQHTMPDSGQPSLVSHKLMENHFLQPNPLDENMDSVDQIQEATPTKEDEATAPGVVSAQVQLTSPRPQRGLREPITDGHTHTVSNGHYGMRESVSPVQSLARHGTEDTEHLGVGSSKVTKMHVSASPGSGLCDASASIGNKRSADIIVDNQSKRAGPAPFGRLPINQPSEQRNVVYQQLDGKDMIMVEGVGQVPLQVLISGLGNDETAMIEISKSGFPGARAHDFDQQHGLISTERGSKATTAAMGNRDDMTMREAQAQAVSQQTELLSSQSRELSYRQRTMMHLARQNGLVMPTKKEFAVSKQTKFDFSRLSGRRDVGRSQTEMKPVDKNVIRKQLRSLRKTTIGFLQQKGAQRLDIEQFEAKKDAALLSHYAGQNLTRNCEYNRRMRLKLESQLEEVQKAIKEKRRAVMEARQTLEQTNKEQHTQAQHLWKLRGLVENLQRTATSATLKPGASRPDSLVETTRTVKREQSSPGRAATQQSAEPSAVCRQLLETDLLSSRDQARQLLSEAEAEKPLMDRELEQLRIDNEKLKNVIKRYQSMVKEVAESGTKKTAKQILETIEDNLRKKVLEKRRAIAHNRRKQGPHAEREAINSELFRPSDRLVASASPHRDAASGPASPAKQVRVNAPRTTVSYGRVNRGGPGSILDTKRFEVMSIAMPLFNRIKLPVDSLVSLLNIVKASFRGEVKQVTLFILDKDMQSKVLDPQPERKHCIKRMQLGGKPVSAVFATPDQLQKPKFNSLHEAQHMVCTPTHLVMPIFAQSNSQLPMPVPGQPSLVLQLAYDPVKLEIAKRSLARAAGGGGNTDAKQSAMLRGRTATFRRLQTRLGSASNGSDAASLGLRATVSEGSADGRSDGSATSLLPGQGKGPITIGFGPNDVLLARILGQYFALNCQYFQLQVVRDLRLKKVTHVLEFAQDLMQARYFREIIRGMRKHCNRLLDCETATLFFKDLTCDNLFTIATMPAKVKDEKGEENIMVDPDGTAFANELVFPDDQIVVLPGDMGVTGDVFQKNSMKVENDFGALITPKHQDTTMNGSLYDSDVDAASDVSYGRNSTIKVQRNTASSKMKREMNARSSVSHSTRVSPMKGLDFPTAAMKRQTALEQILEDNPMAESETADRGLARSSKLKRSKASAAGLPESLRGRSTKRQVQIPPPQSLIGRELGSAGMPPNEPGLVGVGSAESLNSRALRSATGPKVAISQDVNVTATAPPALEKIAANTEIGKILKTPAQGRRQREDSIDAGAQGDILCLRSPPESNRGRSEGMRRPRKRTHSMYDPNVINHIAAPDDKREITASFMPPIDNFAGTKVIKSYCITSLKDDGYSMGERAVGVLQLFNKTDGRNIDRDDAARIQYVSRFLGALAMKACVLTCHQKRLICMIERQRKHFKVDFESYMFGPDQGPLSHMVAPCELLARTTRDYQQLRAKEDAAHFFEPHIPSDQL